MKRKVTALVLTAAMMLSLAACGGNGAKSTSSAPASEPVNSAAEGSTDASGKEEQPAAAEGKSYTINVASTFAPEGPVHQVMEEFKNNIETASGGRIKVVIHPSGALGGAREVSEGVHAGTIEMGALGCEDFEYYAPEYSILEAPYLFRDVDHFKNFLNTHGDQLFSEVQEKSGIITSAWFYRGARMMTSNKKITTPDDLKGLKFRLPSIPVRVSVFEAFGASPTIVDFAELYMALKTGTVDAQENPPETIYSYKYYEAQKYLILSSHIFTLARYITSEEWFNTLTVEDQQLINTAWKDAAAKVAEEYPDPDATYIEKCQEEGMEVVTPDNQAFMELAAPVVEKYNQDNWKPGLLDLIDSTQ
ncbi:MAG: TRAP transporter substrate-binding protein [Lachnospiraceae bacterium]|jgi:tripartite ATP-independent transporter DctP family solute receptor|nr:TRAP transporter substrate-binding protein [Lachnospiraceae bacterium]MCI9590068.1 TRAP transporter substrate-binding protein [Lachnospiraceae bacterium]